MVLLYHTYLYMSIDKVRRVTSKKIGRPPLLYVAHNVAKSHHHESTHDKLSRVNVLFVYLCEEVNHKDEREQNSNNSLKH